MNPDLATKFLENGVIGACVVVLAFVVWRLYKSYDKIQDSRVNEAQAVTDRILKLSEDWLTAISDLTKMVEQHSGNVTELRKENRERLEGVVGAIHDMTRELKDYAEELRRRHRGGGGQP